MMKPYSMFKYANQQPTLQPGQTLVNGRAASTVAPKAGAYNLGTEAGQLQYAQLNDEQRRAYDYLQQQKDLQQAQTSMESILNQRPGRKSALDTAESQRFKSEAYGTGPLAEYQAMREQSRLANQSQQQKMQQGLSDELQNQTLGQAGAQANAYSQLAQSGGLSSGSRERLAGSLGAQSLQARQAARLQNMRGTQDLESQYQQGLMGLTSKEAEARRGMQNAYLGMQSQDVGGANQFAQDVYGKRADVLAGLAKAKMDLTSNAYRRGREE